MLNIFRCLGVLALLVSTCAQADLTLKVLPFTGSESQVIKEHLDAFNRQYINEHSLVSNDYHYFNAENPKPFHLLYWYYDAKYAKRKEAETLYTLNIDGQEHLAAVISFNPMLTAEPHCQPDSSNDSSPTEGHCDWIATRQMVCHLFLFEPKTLALENVTPLNIVRDPRPMPGQKKRGYWYFDEKYPNDPRQIEGWPRCSKLLAVAPAKEVANSLLFTLGYSDSAEPASKHEEDYHPLFKTSVLVSLSTDTSGKVQARQDDSCLGNPNMYASIGDARKVLKRCAAGK